jgi:hypothetical protein
VLSKWDSFTIWSVGRDGKKFFNSLSVENQNKVPGPLCVVCGVLAEQYRQLTATIDGSKVAAFCDIDPKKIGTKHTTRYVGHGVFVPVSKSRANAI